MCVIIVTMLTVLGPKVPLGNACSHSATCNTTGAECRRGFCICPPDYYYVDDQCSMYSVVVVLNNLTCPQCHVVVVVAFVPARQLLNKRPIQCVSCSSCIK